jgi:hypothetical protein
MSDRDSAVVSLGSQFRSSLYQSIALKLCRFSELKNSETLRKASNRSLFHDE